MITIGVTSLKGGVGKSTITFQLASYFASEKKWNVGIRELDSQKSIADILETYGKRLKYMGDLFDSGRLGIEDPEKEYHAVIVDTPPYIQKGAVDAIADLDFVIIPCRYSVLELVSLKKFLPSVIEAKKINPELKYAVLFNMVKNTSMIRDIEEILTEDNVPVFATKISDRIDYGKSMQYGGLFNGVEGNDGFFNERAKDEIRNLVREIQNMLQ